MKWAFDYLAARNMAVGKVAIGHMSCTRRIACPRLLSTVSKSLGISSYKSLIYISLGTHSAGNNGISELLSVTSWSHKYNPRDGWSKDPTRNQRDIIKNSGYLRYL